VTPATIREKHYGIVTDNVDDEQRGRVKVTCATLCPDGSEWPDWVEPVFPYLSSSDKVSSDGGWFFIPDIGVVVELEIAISSPRDETAGATSFDSNDIRWVSCAFARGSDTIADDFIQNYPNRRGYKTGAGHALIFDDTPNDPEVKLLQVNADGNTFLDFDDNGSILLLTSKGIMLFMNQDAEEFTILDTHSNIFVMNGDGWYISDANSNMITGASAGLSLMSSADILMQASGVTIGDAALATPPIIDGVPGGIGGFNDLLNQALLEIVIGLGAVPSASVATSAFQLAVASGIFVSSKTKTE
jgi:hypothetical protein